uniref:Uncharacterized protein n=1 Tax=Candidatus Nitrotoga fabula TaxID=2182327 RepID=A0A2X0SL24_9PROT|nr:protein of unknown function [Candidatus Nitrotoga fabula]
MPNKNNILYLAKAKNLVRGALSLLRETSTPDARRDLWQQEQKAQQQINKALAIAKSRLGQKKLDEFEKWVVDLIGEQNRIARRLGTHLTSLGLLPNELKPQNLPTELHLALNQLQRKWPELLVFAQDAASIAKAIALGDWVGASTMLQATRKRDGYSYWSVETEMALKQAIEGVEALKSLVTSMSICSISINKFFLYHFGVRNEPAQTSSRYKVSLKKKIEDSDISAQLQAYFKFRLYGNLEAEQSNLAAVLAYEQLTTSVDLLFTLIRVNRFILGQKAAFSIETLNAAKRITEALAPISSALGFSNTVRQHKEIGKAELKDHFDSRLMKLAHQAIQIALQPREKWGSVDGSETFIVQGLASQLSTRSDGLLAEELAKRLLNYCWLPVAIELGDITTVPSLPKLFTDSDLNKLSVDEQPTSINDALLLTVQSLTDNSYVGILEELLPLINGLRSHRDGQLSDAIRQLKEAAPLVASEVSRDTIKVVLANYSPRRWQYS